MTLVSTVTVGAGGAASIDFTSIPQTGTDLLLVFSGRTSTASSSGSVVLDFNGGTTDSLLRALTGTGSSILNDGSTQRTPIQIVGSTATANTFSNASIYITNYAGATTKSVSIDAVGENNAADARSNISAANWPYTAAITALKLNGAGDTIAQYSTASLYTITKGSGGATVA